MRDRIVKSVVFWGRIQRDSSRWMDWLLDAQDIIRGLGLDPNYIGIDSTSMSSGKVLCLSRVEKKIKSLIMREEHVNWISLFSLPKGFGTACFDYDALLERSDDHVILITGRSIFESKVGDEVVARIKRHISVSKGEIFAMDRHESPLVYVSGANDSKDFKSLKVMKRFRG